MTTGTGLRTRRPTTRTTLTIGADLLEAADREVAEGRASSRTAFIEEALQRELKRRLWEERDREYALVMEDPDYQAEMDQLMKEFDSADRETWEKIDEWGGQAE
jgi:metal-responsive CopG/Arc/MetJ family transcriptional regulator